METRSEGLMLSYLARIHLEPRQNGRNPRKEKRRYPWIVGSSRSARRIRAESHSTLEISGEIVSHRSKGILNH
jgi:hypothetical protein